MNLVVVTRGIVFVQIESYAEPECLCVFSEIVTDFTIVKNGSARRMDASISACCACRSFKGTNLNFRPASAISTCAYVR